jgi:dihydrofolate reductase
MTTLTVTTFLSLDGVMQAPGGLEEDTSGGFTHGGWTFPYSDEDFGEIIVDIYSRADAFLLGRRTYEIFSGYWPQHHDKNDPISNGLNVLPKYVASTTLEKTDWNNSEIIQGDVVDAVKKLKEQPGRELLVPGSGNLIQTLLKNDLVDEYHLFIFPVILGTGKRLFAEGTIPAKLKQESSRTSSKGVIFSKYISDGKPAYGTF